MSPRINSLTKLQVTPLLVPPGNREKQELETVVGLGSCCSTFPEDERKAFISLGTVVPGRAMVVPAVEVVRELSLRKQTGITSYRR